MREAAHVQILVLPQRQTLLHEALLAQRPSEGRQGIPQSGAGSGRGERRRGDRAGETGRESVSASTCLFCRIVSRELPADIVGETDTLLAFKDVNPQAPVHLLLIPKEHIASVSDITEAHTSLVGQAVQFANRLARQYQLEAGYRVVINCGPQAGQSVFHFHLHLLGGRVLRWPPG